MTIHAKGLTASQVLAELKKLGITHLVWLPDTETRFLYDAVVAEPSLDLVSVCREGEEVPIALGLLVGGKKPVCMMQSTGFYESGDAVRGIALEIGLPLVLFIGHRGFKRSGPITDSAATYLEPILKAWGINYYLIETDDDLSKISKAQKEAEETSKPVAVLIGAEYSKS